VEPLLLRDIHLPEPISWWPPAIGWWIVLGLTLLVSAVLTYLLRQRKRVTPAGLALKELTLLENDPDMPARTKLQALSILLRRVALTLHPRKEVAGLMGENWLRWLDEVTGDTRFSEGPGRWLAEAPYRPVPDVVELAELLALCRDWLNALAKVKKPRTKSQSLLAGKAA
jgi:hypothetical protein